MEYKVFKIYDPEVKNIAVGIRVADCMMLCNADENEKIVEELVTPKLQDLAIANVFNCSPCNVSFNDVIEQRNHYKLDWHRYNLKRALSDKQPVSEDVFDSLADDVSSISGSETESSDKEDSDSGYNEVKEKKGAEAANDSKLTRGRHSKAFFENSDNEIFSVYKCLLSSKKEAFSNSSLISSFMSVLDGPKKWLIIMLGGGHFAAAVFNDNEIAEHKTFHCYTVRAKQGGSQSSRDNKGGGHPKSAGASLRRYNEQGLTQHIQEIMNNWSGSLKQCQLIFFRATGRYNRAVIFGGKNPPLDKSDPRLRNIPFPTKRATFKEVKRVHDVLCTLELYGPADNYKDKYPRSPDKRSSPRKSDVNIPDEVQPIPDGSENIPKKNKKKTNNIDRSKARSSPEREIPGEKINEICQSDSSDDKGEKMALTSSLVNVNLEELKEYDQSGTESDNTKESSDYESQYAKECRKRNRKIAADHMFRLVHGQLVDSCERGDKDLLLRTLKIYDTLPDEVDENDDSVKGYLMSKNDFIRCLNARLRNEIGGTVLHLSASYSLPDFTTLLLEAGADPTIRNKYSFTPYVMSGNKITRKSFKEFAAKYPERVDFKKSNIPPPPTEEMRKTLDERRREKNRMKRRRDKIKKREIREKREEEEDKRRFLELNDRDKRALTAERRMVAAATTNLKNVKPPVLSRCFLCGVDITGKIPFEYGMNRFCSIPCVKAHRLKYNSYSINI